MERQKKIYISIPITGYSIKQVRAEIDRVRGDIEAAGDVAVSPLDGVTDYSRPWIDYMVDDMQLLKNCDAVVFTGHWQNSNGCMVEYYCARAMGLKMFTSEDYHLHSLIGKSFKTPK